MNRLTKLFIVAAIAAFAVPAVAQDPVNQYISADDTSIAMMVKYYPGVSSNTSATMANVQDTSITFEVASAAYTGFECPVSGALGGIIVPSDGDCDTLGEIVDSINATAETFASGFFRAVIVDGLRSDASADLLADTTEEVTRADGFPIYFDTSANFAVGETRALLPAGCRDDISCFVTPSGKLLENPYASQRTVVNWVEGYSTYGSGSSTLQIFSVLPRNKASGSESATTLWSEAMGATTAVKQFTQFQNTPVLGRRNEKVLVRISNSAAQATVIMLVAANRQNP